MNTEPPSATPPDDDKDLSGLGRDLLGGSTPTSGSNPKAGWQPPTVEELHAILPQYEVSRMLGRGGMGAVYMGRQISLDRPVAIKILSGALEEEDFGFKERFKNEARAMAKLSHPGIIAVHDFGETADGLLYIVMEYVDGTDVARMIAAEGRLHTEHAMAITAHVCDALAYAHARGIIHRDIKPANIMVGYDGVVKVADFGLAKVHAGEGQTIGLTMSGMAMGTMHFIAPEALEYGATVDHRADLYAVGVMLFQMLTGKLPQGMFRMPSLQVPGMDPRYDGIIARAMYEDREQRYQSATELRVDLDGILTQPVEKVEAEDTKPAAALPTMARPQRPGGRKKAGAAARRPVPEKAKSKRWGVLAAVIVLCGGGAAAGLYLGREELPEPKPVAQVSATTSAERVESTVAPPPIPSPALTPASLATPPTSTPVADEVEPFVNSLGMKFVPVPGTEVLFCIHETRFRDYAAYAAENPGINSLWKEQKIDGVPVTERPHEHPVGGVNWEETQAFCRWLSQKEGRTYRLPTDEEWSVAVGLGGRERRSPGIVPGDLDGKITDLFPWGSEWPPPAGAGNYSDENYKEVAVQFQYLGHIAGYDDGYRTTAPVMTYQPNPFGLYDMGGNVWEWVEDWRDGNQKVRVLRGASLREASRDLMLSSKRNGALPAYRGVIYGFRIVAELPKETMNATPQLAVVPTPQAAEAKKSEPFTNSLGMKFVPVPGTNILMCIHETRRQDYRTYANEMPGVAGRLNDQTLGGFVVTDRLDEHPIVGVNWDDSKAFCKWLSKKEGRIYRLPTDREWSYAVGIGSQEDWSANITPATRSRKVAKVWPWGNQWPIPSGSGNYSDQSRREKAPTPGASYLDGYNDGYPTTAPVMSFAPNPFGIYDLGGNLWEWCEDWWDSTETGRVLRGGTWTILAADELLSSNRFYREQGARGGDHGFRLVMELTTPVSGPVEAEAESGAAKVSLTTAQTFQPASPVGSVSSSVVSVTKEQPFENSLGMKFVPVPGTDVLMCIHETRRKDYFVYSGEAPGVAGVLGDQTLEGFTATDRPNEHPIVGLSWEDAHAFCDWLNRKEGKTYRLPTDREWSHAVGLGEMETWTAETTPAMLSRKVTQVWPWGNAWPPPAGAGSYSDSSRKAKAPRAGAIYLEDLDDGFPTTAPVMNFQPNPIGIYDLGGNVWEWCEDWFDAARAGRVLRGGCWTSGDKNELLSSHRHYFSANSRGSGTGFRLVMELPATIAADMINARAADAATPVTPSSTAATSAPAIHQLPEILTRIANYQKARHTQLSELTTKYRAALVSAKETATNGGALDEVAAVDSAIAAAASLADLIEKNLGATEVVPLPLLASPGESAPARLSDLQKIFVSELTKIEATLAAGLDQSLEAAQVALVQAEKFDEARAVEAYRKQIIAVFSSPEANRPESATATNPTPAAAATPWPADRQYRSNGGFRTWSSEANDSGTDLRQLRGVEDPVQLLVLGSGWVVLRANGEVVSNIDRVKAWKEISRICRGDDGCFALITRQGELIIHPEPTDKANEVPKDLGPVRDAYVSANRQVAILEDGGLVAWGLAHDGETSPRNPEWKDKPVLPAGRTAVAMSNVPAAMALRLDDGALLRWGANGGEGRFTANFQNTMSSGFAVNTVGLHAIPNGDAPIIAWSWRGGDPLSPFPTDVRGAAFINTNRHFVVLGRDGKLVLDPMCQERDISAALDLVTGTDPRLISVQLPERAEAVARLLWFDPTAVAR